MTKDDILQYLSKSDILDDDSLQTEIQKMKSRKKYLEMHPYTITHRKDGKWMTYFPPENGRRIQKERYTRKEIEDLIVDYWCKQTNSATIAEVFNEWNNYRLEVGQISPSTKNRNAQIFKRFYGGDFGNRRIDSVEPIEWIEFLERQVPEHDIQSKAFSNLKGLTKGFLKRAKRLGLIDWNVEEMIHDVETPRYAFRRTEKDNRAEVFNEDETPVIMRYLIEHIDNQCNVCLLLMFVTGIRVGEAITLKHSDIHDGAIDIQRTETRIAGKNGKTIYAVSDKPKTVASFRVVVLPTDYSWLLENLQRLNPNGEWVFVGELSHERMTYNTMRRHLEYVCKNCGIYPKSLHKIRKTYSSILLDNGVDNRLILDQMGHTNISMDELCYHRTRRNIERKREILDAVPEFRMPQSDVSTNQQTNQLAVKNC